MTPNLESVGEDSSLSEVANAVRAEGVGTHVALGFAVRSFGGWLLRAGGDERSLFDLASLTKPMFAAACVELGLLPNLQLGQLLPETMGTPVGTASVLHLLSHRAGLSAHVPLYLTCSDETFAKRWPHQIDRGRAIEMAARSLREGDGAALATPLYSDLGYILMGEAAARSASLRDAGALIEQTIVSSLGLGRDLGTASGLLERESAAASRFVPTETVPWRGGEICGAVHDENAWALTGYGGSGHAGMFGTVEAVLRFAVHVVESRQTYGWLLAPRPGGTIRAGFDGKSQEGSSAGTRMSKTAVGHLGFTGTSFWIDLEQGVVVALLTNRVRPTRDNQRIKDIRPRVHDLLFARAISAARSAYKIG